MVSYILPMKVPQASRASLVYRIGQVPNLFMLETLIAAASNSIALTIESGKGEDACSSG